MAGADNLRPPRSTDEARERGRKGGIASGAARRRKRALKAALADMLTMPLPDDAAAKLDALGIGPEDADYQAAVAATLIRKAVDGNIRAIQLLFTLTGDDPYAKARTDETRIKRAELKERQRQYDTDRADKQAQSETDDDLAAAWLEAVLMEGGNDGV